MIVHNTCQACNTTYSIEWHDLNYIEHDVENDEYEELEPNLCPFCGYEVSEEYEDEL